MAAPRGGGHGGVFWRRRLETGEGVPGSPVPRRRSEEVLKFPGGRIPADVEEVIWGSRIGGASEIQRAR